MTPADGPSETRTRRARIDPRLRADGWSVVLYNGNGGGSYATLSLTGGLPTSCTDRGVVALSHAGIQNGQ